MTTSQVLKHFDQYDFFDRDLLYYFVKRKLISFNRIRRGRGWLREFDPNEVARLDTLLQRYAKKRVIDMGDESQLSISVNRHQQTSLRSVWPPSPAGDELEEVLAPITDPLSLGSSRNIHLRSVGKPSAETLGLDVPLQSGVRAFLDSCNSALSDYRGTLRTIAAGVRDLFDAEACELLVANPHDLDELILEEQACGEPPSRSAGSTPRTRFSSRWLADALTQSGHAEAVFIARFSQADLSGSSYVKARDWAHLSQPLISLLRIAVRDRKGRVVARLEVENKRGLKEGVADARSFAEDDENVAGVVARVVASVLNNLSLLASLTRIGRAIKRGDELQSVLDEILWTGQSLTGANRGDIALFSEARGELIITAQRGESVLARGKRAPEKSVLRTLWKSSQDSGQNSDLIENVRHRPYYYPANGFTQSEIAVAFDQGVLNLESFRPGTFDHFDLDLLHDLGSCASVAVGMLSKRKSSPLALRSLGHIQAEDWFHLLGPLLDSMVEGPSEAAILYICDDSRKLLRIVATVRCESAQINPGDFAYHYEETALATKVRRERAPYLTRNPREDPNVHQTFEKFGIAGPLIGIPLLYGKDVVGVLVLWSIDDGQSALRGEAELNSRAARLQTASASLAVNIRKLESDYNKSLMFAWLHRVLVVAQVASTLEEKMRVVLDALIASGFDRARLFLWDEAANKFVGRLSSGMSNPELFDGLLIDPNTNPFAGDTRASALTDPVARKYDPSLQKDPDSRRLEKDENLPWACVPVVLIGRKLFAQISCDCARSGRDITRDDLEFLTVLGAVASQIFASHEGTSTTNVAVPIDNDLLSRLMGTSIVGTAGVEYH